VRCRPVVMWTGRSPEFGNTDAERTPAMNEEYGVQSKYRKPKSCAERREECRRKVAIEQAALGRARHPLGFPQATVPSVALPLRIA